MIKRIRRRCRSETVNAISYQRFLSGTLFRPLVALAAAAALCFTAPRVNAEAPQYTVTVLNSPGGIVTQPSGINASGEVAGYSETLTGQTGIRNPSEKRILQRGHAETRINGARHAATEENERLVPEEFPQDLERNSFGKRGFRHQSFS